MKVLALVTAPYDTSPGQRFRLEQWARYLEKDGFHFTFVPFEDEALHQVIYKQGQVVQKAALMFKALERRFGLLPALKNYDMVFLFREAALIGPAMLETLIARIGLPIVFDFDDAIWVPQISSANKYFSYLKFFSKTASICRESRHITVGNSYLAEYARKYNENVTIVPTTIDTEAHHTVRPLRNPDDRSPLTIGWTGSFSTVQYLDTLHDALKQVRQCHSFRLHVIGTDRYQVDGVDTFAQAWRVESEIKDLHQFDIGIMPLSDNEWTRGKCGFKILQYMAVGIPAVAAPVGVNTEIIQDGVNGFLAATEEEWVEKLSLLIENANLRREMGLAGRRTVEERYSAKVWVPRIGEILKSVATIRGKK